MRTAWGRFSSVGWFICRCRLLGPCCSLIMAGPGPRAPALPPAVLQDACLSFPTLSLFWPQQLQKGWPTGFHSWFASRCRQKQPKRVYFWPNQNQIQHVEPETPSTWQGRAHHSSRCPRGPELQEWVAAAASPECTEEKAAKQEGGDGDALLLSPHRNFLPATAKDASRWGGFAPGAPRTSGHSSQNCSLAQSLHHGQGSRLCRQSHVECHHHCRPLCISLPPSSSCVPPARQHLQSLKISQILYFGAKVLRSPTHSVAWEEGDHPPPPAHQLHRCVVAVPTQRCHISKPVASQSPW